MEERPDTPYNRRAVKRGRDALLGVLSLVAFVGIMAYVWFFDLPSGAHWTVGSYLLFMGREAFLALFFLGALLLCAFAWLWRLIARALSQ